MRHQKETDYLIAALATKEGPYPEELRKRLEAGTLQLTTAAKWIEKVLAAAVLLCIVVGAAFLLACIVGGGWRLLQLIWP